jgi:hypothetical protein
VSIRARQAVSAVGLVAVVAGIPAVLVGVVGWPLPRRWPGVDEVGSALENGWRPDQAFVLGALAVLGWLVWAQLVRHVVVELAAHRRTVALGEPVAAPAARHGLGPGVARWLVAGLFVAGPVHPSTDLASRPGIPVVLHETRALEPLMVAAAAPIAAEPVQAAAPSYVVRTWEERRDCLWNIAERYLGDPMRWPELLKLNAGAVQPGGRSLAEDPQHWVHPGMELRLPPDAAGSDLVLVPPPGPPPAEAEPLPPAGHAPAEEARPAPSPGSSSEPPAASRGSTPAPPAAISTTTTTPLSPTTIVSLEGGASRRRGIDAPDPIPLGRDAMRLAAALALGLPVFAAGGIALHLSRRRRIQLSRHRPGRDIVRPAPALEPLERRIRAIAVDEASAWVDAALRTLGAELRRASLTVPRITCVRAGDLGLEILLAEAAPEPPPSFAAVDDGHVWRLDPDLDLAELHHRAGDAVAPLPTLVSVGVTPEGPVLVDLESFGVVSVEGDDARISALLAGAALELASVNWAEGVDLRVAGGPAALQKIEGVRMVEDLASLGEDLAATAAWVSDALGDRHSTLAARLDQPGEEWLPTVAVVDDAGAAGALGEVVGPVRPGSGIAVLARGPVPGARWRLHVVAEGFARLEGPTGLDVHELRATGWEPPVVETDVGDLDQAAIHGAASLLSAASHDADVAPVVHLDGDGPRVVQRCGREDYDVWVEVLGPVEVSGWAEPVGRRRKLEELVVYLATHELPVPGERLRCAVWAEVEVASKSFIQAMSRARRHLGGQRHLPEASGGAYRLGPGVGCSWSAFKELTGAAGAAARSDPDQAMALWRQALGLVRGEPFAGVTKGSYIWAWSEGLAYEMQVAITRTADALGTLALAQDDPDTAEWAVRQGLLAMPTQLSLFDWEMRVAAHRNDLDGLNAAFAARRRAEEALDPLAEVPPDTVRLFETLVAHVRGQRRSKVGS